MTGQLGTHTSSPGAVSSASGLSDAASSKSNAFALMPPDSGQESKQKSALQESLQKEVQKLLQERANIDRQLTTVCKFLDDMYSPQ